jgi:tetratricopeptide (TPR) repeat protein
MARLDRLALGGALLATTLFLGFPAAADEPPPTDAATKSAHVEKLNDEGAAAYHARDFRKANEKFQQAYALDPDPNILYNIAKTYELLGDDQAALEKFESFVNQPGADPQGRAKAHQKIAEIKQRIAEGKKGGAAQGGAGPAPASSPQGQRLVVPTILALGVGIAGVTVGTIFGVGALGKRSDLDNVCKDKACPDSSSSDISTLKTSSTISTIGFIAGGVGLASAAVLYIVGRPSRTETARGVRITPVAGPTSVGLAGQF